MVIPKTQKFQKKTQKMRKIAKNCGKLRNIAKKLRKLRKIAKIAENCEGQFPPLDYGYMCKCVQINTPPRTWVDFEHNHTHQILHMSPYFIRRLQVASRGSPAAGR